MATIIENLNELESNYSILFCDVWGCIHNGIEAFETANHALKNFRSKGGLVVLLTNAPRPEEAVKRQLEAIGVCRNSYDHIVTAGDAALEFITGNTLGKKIYHIGPEKDAAFFYTLFSTSRGSNFSFSGLDEADFIVCTGLFDDAKETPNDYKTTFEIARNRDLAMVCTNPDIYVDFGINRIFCAGALAVAYQKIGGKVYSFGKPYHEIYNFAYKLLQNNNITTENSKILCIGDGWNTDIVGAKNQELQSLFIANGLERKSLIGSNGALDTMKLAAFLNAKEESTDYVINYLK